MDPSRKGWDSSAEPVGEAGERSLFKDWFHGWISSSPGAYLVCMHRDKNPFSASPLNSFPLYNFTVYLRGHLQVQPWTRTPLL